jgi:hypothetical protein
MNSIIQILLIVACIAAFVSAFPQYEDQHVADNQNEEDQQNFDYQQQFQDNQGTVDEHESGVDDRGKIGGAIKVLKGAGQILKGTVQVGKGIAEILLDNEETQNQNINHDNEYEN